MKHAFPIMRNGRALVFDPSVTNGSVHGAAGEPGAVVPRDAREPKVDFVSRVGAWMAQQPFVFLVPAVAAIVLSRWLPNLVRQDTWLALVSGRLVWADGLPHHDTLTIWPHGGEWVDQQWLGQLAIYALHAAGGFRLLGVVHIIVVVTAFALALAFAVRSGATGRSAALVGAVALFVAVGNTVVRTQRCGSYGTW